MPLVEGKLTGYFDPGCVLVTLFDSVCPVPSAGENMDARCEATRDSDLMQRDIPLLDFVRLGGRYLDKLKRIRETEDKKERSFLKRKLLPAATISATMLTRAGNLDLDKKINHYNGLVVLDFDDVEDIEGAKMKLGLLPYVWYVSLSASGRGLYAIIPTENTDYRLHKVYFEALWAGVCRLKWNGGSMPTAKAVGFGRNVTEACIRNAHCAWHAGQSAPCFQTRCSRRS